MLGGIELENLCEHVVELRIGPIVVESLGCQDNDRSNEGHDRDRTGSAAKVSSTFVAVEKDLFLLFIS